MKSFSKFLQESYLNEEPAGRPARRRTGGPTPEQVKADIDAKEAAAAERKSARKPSGAAARPDLQFKKSTVASPAKPKSAGAAKDPWNQFPKKPQPQMGLPKEGPSSTLPGRTLAPAGGTSAKSALPAAGQTAKGDKLVKASPSTPTRAPIQQIRTNLNVPTPSALPSKPKQLALPAAGQTSAPKPQASTGKPPGLPPSGRKPSPTPTPSTITQGKMPTGAKPTGKWAKIGKFAGPATAALDTALSTADERSKGSGWARSLAKGATVAAGGLAGGALGALGGGGIGSAALGTAGAIGGAEAAGKAFDVAAGANAKERAAMAKANRQRQAGTAIKGIGGKTTFDTKKNTMTTGTGSQKKTVGLAKTGVVQRGGQSVAGHLAYKGGKAVYKAGPSAQSLAKTSSNPLERIGRSLFAGAYKKHDAVKAQQALSKARQSDAARNKALGVKYLPGK
jgi:hypothetical protein